MERLQELIQEKSVIKENDILIVDAFLNQQVDIDLLNAMANEWKRLFKDSKITKVVTIESAGIVVGTAAALALNVPLVYAKKEYSNRIPEGTYASKIYSFTKKRSYYTYIPEDYLSAEDNVLIVDDVIANGWASEGLCDIINQSGASLEGIAVAIEKCYYLGANRLRNNGVRIESLAKIKSVSFAEQKIEFED